MPSPSDRSAAACAAAAEFIELCRDDPALGIVGGGVAFVIDGEPRLISGFGHIDLAGSAPYDVSTVQNIGSVSKAFISATLATLVEAGEIDWDAPVRRYIPEFSLADAAVADAMTVRDLTASRTPIAWPALPLPYYEDYIYSTGTGTASYLGRLALAPVSGRLHRSRFAYDGGLMAVAAILAERVTGRSFAACQLPLFDALGMTSTSLVETYGTREARHHQWAGNRMVEIASTFMRLKPGGVPAGGIRTSIADYTRWMLYQLGLQPGRPGASMLGEQHRVHVSIPQSRHADVRASGYEAGPLMGYGLGWRIDLYRGRYSVFHGGSNPGIRAFVRLIPGERFGAAVMQNSDANDYAFAQAVISLVHDVALEGRPAVLGQRCDDLRRRVADIRAERAPALADAPKAEFQPVALPDVYTGQYRFPGHAGGDLVVREVDEALVALSGLFRLQLRPWRGDVFTIGYSDDFLGPLYGSGGEFRHLPATATFERCGDRAVRLTISDGVESAVAQRCD